MPSRHTQELEAEHKRYLLGKGVAVEVLDAGEHDFSPSHHAHLTSEPDRTLSQVSASVINSLKLVTPTDQKIATTNGNSDNKKIQLGHMNSYEGNMSTRSSEQANNNLSSQSNGPNMSRSRPNGNMGPHSPISVSPSVRAISSEFGPTRMQSSFGKPEENTPPGDTTTQPWSSAVGKSTLGKSGRVIEQLQSQNDSLKRDLQLTKLQAEEARIESKMYQGQMEGLNATIADREHQTSVNDMLLKRKERQLGEYKDLLETERRKAILAVESERNWRAELDKGRRENQTKVDQASNYALLCRGRYDTLASHWKDEGNLVNTTVQKMGLEIEAILAASKHDKMLRDRLEGVCEQQSQELAAMRKNQEAQAALFERYKAVQEEALKSIKAAASLQDAKNKKQIEDATKTLGELRWALAVQKNNNDRAGSEATKRPEEQC